ncbi:transcription factor HHO5 [Arachis duranensis]|uniref:Transcription factor HHO5 n=1 Tax=Arachis duranensis TaxID=130453 RepID=A0A9C6TVW8_ARADU|nr:transcription factor HHO5 [Arachis duranensis]
MELSLDLSLSFVPKTISMFLGDVSRSTQISDKLAMLDDFLNRLEDEMTKIHAFKRELPLCMLLVTDAITRLKEEKLRCMGMQDPQPLTTQEPHHNNNNWMTSLQLWRQRCEEDCSVPENPIKRRENKNRSGGGGGVALLNGNSKEVSKVPGFSLMTTTPAPELKSSSSKSNSSSLFMNRVEIQAQQSQNPRKQRRCWSPELHRRFINALQQLGGAQVATPKQIRELMQVESLTNDEVKSHLQKYRLHVRKFPVSSSAEHDANNNNIDDDDEDDLWEMKKKDQCGKGNKNSSSQSQSGSPQGPLLLAGSVKGLSSMDADDEHSDCRNWKAAIHHQPPESDNHSR